MLPMSYAGVRRRPAGRGALELLELLGIGYCRERARQLSGGEQQRVAIATALSTARGAVRRRAAELDSRQRRGLRPLRGRTASSA